MTDREGRWTWRDTLAANAWWDLQTRRRKNETTKGPADEVDFPDVVSGAHPEVGETDTND